MKEKTSYMQEIADFGFLPKKNINQNSIIPPQKLIGLSEIQWKTTCTNLGFSSYMNGVYCEIRLPRFLITFLIFI